MDSFFWFLLILGFLVLIHELGHFLAAKAVGVRVERFSLGFPPRLIGKTIAGTDYCLSWLPIGGYVKLAGMIDESLDTQAAGKPWEFQSKAQWQKFLVIFAGPLMSFLLALAIYSGFAYYDGVPTTRVSALTANGPAQQAGLREGDEIIEIDGMPVASWYGLSEKILADADNALHLRIRRGAKVLDIPVSPESRLSGKNRLLGIVPELHPVPLAGALAAGSERTAFLTKFVGGTLVKVLTGRESFKKNVAGPVRIAQRLGEVAESDMAALLKFAAFLSLQLALLNLLPIPALDGGHLAFIAFETLIGRPLSIRVRLAAQQIGMALLLVLMVFVFLNDLQKIFSP